MEVSISNDQWSKLLDAGTHDGETYTTGDLDKMVSEYANRNDGDKAPVGLGTPLEGKKEVFGRVDALRRKGNSLEAKFANIDPRVEHLCGRGAFDKTSVQVKRSPNGDALQRVGLISPTWDRSVLHHDQTPSIDELWGKHFGSKDHMFAESPLAGQWLELFRAGDYGSKGTFTNSDLDQVVNNFDPSFHEPPAVVGHPENDAPAYAWVDGLKRQDNVLLGKLKLVQPQFEEMVKSGRFKKRSISLYNTAKGYALRHVGFLGAQPPNVKGLADASFKEDRLRFITVTFGESESNALAAVDRLKQDGYWLPLMDQLNFSESLTQLEGTPALDMFINAVKMSVDAWGIDPSNARLSRRAKQYASFHGVSFNEGLDRVQEQQAIGALSMGGAAQTKCSGVKLNERARYIAWSRGVTFGEALDRAIEEDPDLRLS